MSPLTVSFNEADAWVDEQRSLGNNVRWDNYTMVFFKRTDHGFSNVDGAFQKMDWKSKKRGGYWGMEYRVDPNAQGNWVIKGKYVRSQG